MKVELTVFLISVLDGGEWSRRSPRCQLRRTLGSEKREISCPLPRNESQFVGCPARIPNLTSHCGPRWRSWLRHCTTNRKVAGSIPDGVIGIFHWPNPFGRTMALEQLSL
jgi:hypothetical protein